MGKILTIIAIIYIVYYVGNIIYDLFIRKENLKDDENTSEEFSIDEAVNQNEEPLLNVEIDDVQDLHTPNSFNTNKFNIEPSANNTADPEYWRQKFEEEQNMDDFSNKERHSNQNFEETSEEPVGNSSSNRNDEKITKWEDLLNMAETKVQLVSNIDGYKVYKAI